MFFKAIAPACAKGISFTIKVEAADDGKLAVSITPTSESGKSGFSLAAKQFIASPAEFDNEFSSVMEGFAVTQQTLAQQLKDCELVAQEISKAAAAAAQEKPKASVSTSKGTRPKAGNQAPAGLLEDDGTHDADDEAEEFGAHAPASSKPIAAPAPAVNAGFDFALDL